MLKGEWSGGAGQRFGFVLIVLFWTALGEDLPGGGWRFWYEQELFGMPAYYFYLAATLALLLPLLLPTPSRALISALRSARLTPWVVVAWAALVLALIRALVDGAPDPFVDWRDLFVLAVVAAMAFRWLAAQPWRNWALIDIAVGYGLVSLVYLAIWAFGGGVTILGVRVPTFHSALLYMNVFAGLALVLVWATTIRQAPVAYGVLVRLGAITNSVVVLLSLRRSWWLAWGVGMAVVLYSLLKRRWERGRGALGLSLALVGVVVAAFVLLGTETVLARLESFLPGSDNEFSATNEDHFNDIRDAIQVVGREPIIGYGIGQFYETNLTANWKSESFDVHNALLHAWLKFGLIGAAAYLGFHIAWIRSSWRLSRSDDTFAPGLAAAALYIAGNMLGTVVGTWPYRSVQLAIFHGLLLAGLALGVCAREPRESVSREMISVG